MKDSANSCSAPPSTINQNQNTHIGLALPLLHGNEIVVWNLRKTETARVILLAAVLALDQLGVLARLVLMTNRTDVLHVGFANVLHRNPNVSRQAGR